MRCDSIAAQGIDDRRRNKPRLAQTQIHIRRFKHGVTQFGETVAQRCCGFVGLLRRFQRQHLCTDGLTPSASLMVSVRPCIITQASARPARGALPIFCSACSQR
jgi:hypothetical protein